MKPRHALAAIFCLALMTLAALARAEDMPPSPGGGDPDLPQPFDATAMLPMLKNSPFARVVDYTDSLQLTGVAWVEGRPMATLVDRHTKTRYVVSEQPNAQGWRLAEAALGDDLHETEVKLRMGEEMVTFHYHESQLSPEPAKVKAPKNMPPASQAAGRSASAGTSAYLNNADQDYYRNGMSKAARDKFKDSMRSHQDKMAKMTDDQRAAYSQKIFNKIKAQEQSGQLANPPKKAKR